MRRFRFNLLTLLVILTVAAVAIVWGQQYTELQRLRASHRQSLKAKLRAEESKLSMYERLLNRDGVPANPVRDVAFNRRRQAATDEIAKLKEELGELDN
jgi:hypothetical protein